jgi:hypothetical protein
MDHGKEIAMSNRARPERDERDNRNDDDDRRMASERNDEDSETAGYTHRQGDQQRPQGNPGQERGSNPPRKKK